MFILGAQDDENAVRKLFTGADAAFVNTNSWVLGSKGDTYLGIRIFELAVQCGVKHYIYSSLDNTGLETRFEDKTRAQHYDGKAHVQQWMSAVPQAPMRWSILTTGPYIEQLFGFMSPSQAEDGVWEFRIPVGNGEIPYVHLGDLGTYVRWILEHPEESAGMNVQAAIEDITLDSLAKAFTAVTGKPARGVSPSIEDWFNEIGWTSVLDVKVGERHLRENDPSLVSVRESFSNWLRLYESSIIHRDYALLDRIHPQRVRSVDEWMRKVTYTGDRTRDYTFTSPAGV